METVALTNRYKKRRGSIVLSLHIPKIRPSHCPQDKDKQRKDSPRRVDMHIHTTAQESQTYTYADKPR